MTFSVKVPPELRRVLRKEYADYTAETDMTQTERESLREWVSKGNSPYSNPANIADDKGDEVDFVEALRIMDELADCR